MNSEPYPKEKIIAGTSYLTMGMVGFVWLILGLFTKAKLRPFLQYHIFQSIFISLAFTVISLFLGWLSNLLSLIPIINKIVAQITFLINMPFLFGYSFLQTIIYTFVIYLAITSFMGKYTYIPWVSDIIDHNVGN